MFIYIRAAIIAATAITATGAAAVVPFDVRYESENAGIQTTTATFSVGGVETFDTLPSGSQSFTTDFGTAGAITGTYTAVKVQSADEYGGAGGTGKYAVTFTPGGYALDLSSTIRGGVNYFGYWLSALDTGNQVTFYSKGRVLFTFHPSDVIAAVGAAANPAQYYGNPNPAFAGRDRQEPFVFLDFFSNARPFDRVVFAENPRTGGYESDNHTVGHFVTKGTSTSVALTPASFPTSAVAEPAAWAMMVAGFGLVGAGFRRRQRAVAA